jgi:RNA polymerase sigma factor (TIGR02999 family)
VPLSEIAQTAPGSDQSEPRLAVQRQGLYAKRLRLNELKSKMASKPDVTAILTQWGRGNPSAINELLPLVYAELRRIAARQLRSERVGHTLQPTALVHEVYLRLVDQRNVDWRNRAHFFGVAAQVMRRILVDHARRHGARKRGDGVARVSIDEAKGVVAPDGIPVLALDQALDRLAGMDEDLARIVELRAFGGMTIEEAACVLKVSRTTANREWRTAKAWLTRELGLERRA